MNKQDCVENSAFSLLVIIVDRGKGSHLLNFAKAKGAKDTSAFLGYGTVRSKILQLMQLDDSEKEVILIIIPTLREEEILQALNDKFHLEKPGRGIAFTIPLAGLFRQKEEKRLFWREETIPDHDALEYTSIFIVVNKGRAEDIIHQSQKLGYYGGTIIHAHGTAGRNDQFLDRSVEPEKDAVLMIMKTEQANTLAAVLHEEFRLDQPNTGFMVLMPVSRTCGLYQGNGLTEATPRKRETKKTQLMTLLMVPLDCVDKVVETARNAGAPGATKIRSRTASPDTKGLFNLAIELEEELVVITADIGATRKICKRILEQLRVEPGLSVAAYILPVEQF